MDTLCKNAKLGDGNMSIPPNCVNARIIMNGKNVQWLEFKHRLAKKLGYDVSDLLSAYSGYTDKWSLVQFRTKTDERITSVVNMSRRRVIESLTKFDLILWYLDDGSWHKSKKTMHLYCNALSDSDTYALVDQIERLYWFRPSIRYDRKKDGRCYPYLYFPRSLVIKFKRDVERFLRTLKIDSMLYKVGEGDIPQ